MKIVYTHPNGNTAIQSVPSQSDVAKTLATVSYLDGTGWLRFSDFTDPNRQYDIQKAIAAGAALSTFDVATMNEQQFLQFIIERDLPAGASDIRIVEDHEIPDDRTFRDALQPDLTHCPVKSAEITRDRLRQERKPLLEQLDVEMIRAMAKGEDHQHIEERKQRLRDITQRVQDGMTIDELKLISVHDA